jgi:hypothetical protein
MENVIRLSVWVFSCGAVSLLSLPEQRGAHTEFGGEPSSC